VHKDCDLMERRGERGRRKKGRLQDLFRAVREFSGGRQQGQAGRLLLLDWKSGMTGLRSKGRKTEAAEPNGSTDATPSVSYF
jgi:hypothetical protein